MTKSIAMGAGRTAARQKLSSVVCWTRMQAEAGQTIDAIISRKEVERSAGGGLFCWGIGNAPPRSLPAIVREGTKIDVVFSLMKSRPRALDMAPPRIVVWRSYVDINGQEHALPIHMLVTSRLKDNGRAHYALMCKTTHSLGIRDMGTFDPTAYRNVSAAGKPVGASQVTALLRRVAPPSQAADYRVNLRASLVESCWVKLSDPLEVTAKRRAELNETLASASQMSSSDWVQFVMRLRSKKKSTRRNQAQQLALFSYQMS